MTDPMLWHSLLWAHCFGEVLAEDTMPTSVSARFEEAEARRHVRARWREVQWSLRKGDLR